MIIVRKKFNLNALGGCSLYELGIIGVGSKMQQKMQTAVLAFYRKCGSNSGLRQILQQAVALAAVVGARSVDVAFKLTDIE